MDILVYLFKNRIHEYLNINSFKNEESNEMSADHAHVQGASGGESTSSLVASGSHSLTIDAEYLFGFQIYIFLILCNGCLSPDY